MWNDGGYGGGGFLDATYNSPSGESNAGEKKAKERRAENLVPVTIGQILKSNEEFKINELVVHMVTFVGIVKSIDISSTKATYVIEDTTGQVEAVVWLDGPLEGEQPLMNSYSRVCGTIRSQHDKRYVMVLHMEPLKDLNELTNHLLEVMEVSQFAPEISELEQGGNKMPNMNTTNNQLPNSLMNMNQPVDDGLDAQAPTDPRQRMVFKVIWDAASIEANGVNVPFIAQKLNGRMNVDQIRGVTEFLLQEGFIFSTIDDEHFTVTR